MEPKLNCSILLVIFSIIDISFSAVFIGYVYKSTEDHYRNSRNANVHRGLILSLSSKEKNRICLDLFSDKLGPITTGLELLSLMLEHGSQPIEITDDLTNQGAAAHPVMVRPISAIGAHYTPTDKEDIFFKCTIKNYPTPISTEKSEFFVSSAYQPNLMYQGSEWGEKGRSVGISMIQYFLLSPQFVTFDQTDLEKQYVATRQIFRNLERESAGYINLVEKKDTISTLSTWQIFVLCSTILSSPTYRDARRQFSYDWRKYKKYTETESYSKYESWRLSFRDQVYQSQGWTASCVFCMTLPPDPNETSRRLKNVFFTRDFGDPNSVYILTELTKGAVFITEYMKNVPILVNAGVLPQMTPFITRDTDSSMN